MDAHDRGIAKIDGDTMTLMPLPMALDAALVAPQTYTWPGRIEDVGVEQLACESAFDASNKHDEEHAWNAISIENARNVWVRQVSCKHFAGSAVYASESSSAVTVENCSSTNPVSELGVYRRHTFYTAGQLTLFRRCTADSGRHDFAVGYLAAGPNAFVECKATNAYQFSGPIERATSVPMIVSRSTAAAALTNRDGASGRGQTPTRFCNVTPLITCRMPPTAQNWAIGRQGQLSATATGVP